MILLFGRSVVCLRKYDKILDCFLYRCSRWGFLYVIGCYSDWDGISSFGNRFFVALAPIFIIGLAAFLGWFANVWQSPRATVIASSAVGTFILWNLGLIFQWGMHWIPERGPISWRAAAYNQVVAVPQEAASTLRIYLTSRGTLMDRIEQRDVQQLKQSQGAK